MKKPDRIDSDSPARALAYHQASKHHLDRYAPGPGGLDWANQPDPFRRYAGASRIELPLRADSLAASFGTVHRGERPAAYPLERDAVAILFELALGLSAWKQHGGSRWALRCNPSSGNLHPTEAYLLVGGFKGLADGLYHYHPEYRARYRECRPIGQALYLEAEIHGLRGTGIGCYFDDALHQLIGLAPAEAGSAALQSVYHFTVGVPLDDARIATEAPYAHLRREPTGGPRV